MSRRHWVPDQLWDVRKDALSMAARVVYVALCRCVTKGEAQPSVARLAAMVAAHRTTVLDALADLEHANMVVPTKRFGAANAYRLTKPQEWNVLLTSRPERPVVSMTSRHERLVGVGTGRPESPNRSDGRPEPVAVGDTLGITSGRTAGSEAVAVAESTPQPGPITASEARAAVEVMLRKTTSLMPGPPSTRR